MSKQSLHQNYLCEIRGEDDTRKTEEVLVVYYNPICPKEKEPVQNYSPVERIPNKASHHMKMNKNYLKWCYNCDNEKTLFQSEGCYVCRNCGEAEFGVIIEPETSRHRGKYKRMNHLANILKRFQAREWLDVPDEVCDIIKNELGQRDCTLQLIKSILKKHGLSRYYNNIQQIYCRITGADPINLPKEIEEKIIYMFRVMQNSFKKHCPPKRKSFLSYSYILNKLFKILDLEEYAKYFKVPERKKEQDEIWKKICEDMDWKFV